MAPGSRPGGCVSAPRPVQLRLGFFCRLPLFIRSLALICPLFSLAWLHREKDEDEGIPSETEDDKRQLETKAKEMRGERTLIPRLRWVLAPGSHTLTLLAVCLRRSDLLKQKDSEIMSLLEEKVQLFRGMWEGLHPSEDVCRGVEPFFRSASGQEPPRGSSVLNNALQEGEAPPGLRTGLGTFFCHLQTCFHPVSRATDLISWVVAHAEKAAVVQSNQDVVSMATCWFDYTAMKTRPRTVISSSSAFAEADRDG